MEITGAFFALRVSIQFDAEEAESVADPLRGWRRVFADARGEDERVQSTERRGDAAAVLPIPGRVGESQIRIGQADAVNLPHSDRFSGLPV